MIPADVGERPRGGATEPKGPLVWEKFIGANRGELAAARGADPTDLLPGEKRAIQADANPGTDETDANPAADFF